MDRLIEMSIDPRDYDLGELRGEVDEGFVYPEADRSRRDSGEALRSGHYRELLLLQARAEGADLEKPYLDALPGSFEAERVAFEWLEFLVEKGGFKRAHDALRHYRTLGWLTEPVERGLQDYLAGVPESDPAETRPFDQSDHLLSLIYIGKLASA